MFAVVYHTDDDSIPSVIGPFETRREAEKITVADSPLVDYINTPYYVNVTELNPPHTASIVWDEINGQALGEGVTIKQNRD